MKKQSQEEFIKKSQNIFGDKLEYFKVNYVNSTQNVILVCKKHGEFEVPPGPHLSYKRGCPYCSGRIHINDFKEKSRKTHEDKYNYDKVCLKNVKIKVIITCKSHGDFYQAPGKHIKGQGCPKCKKSAKKDLNYVITMGQIINNNFYDYSKSVYKKMSVKIEIICPK